MKIALSLDPKRKKRTPAPGLTANPLCTSCANTQKTTAGLGRFSLPRKRNRLRRNVRVEDNKPRGTYQCAVSVDLKWLNSYSRNTPPLNKHFPRYLRTTAMLSHKPRSPPYLTPKKHRYRRVTRTTVSFYSAHRPLRKHAALLQQVSLDERPRQTILVLRKLQLEELAEPRRVVVPQRLRVTERLQDGRGVHHLLLQPRHAPHRPVCQKAAETRDVRGNTGEVRR